jgi:hypothetical protein
MNQFFRTLFRPSKASKSFGQSSLLHSKNDLASIQDGSENATRQQLIQTLHHDLMRKHGIPTEWMACHTQVMVSRSKGTGMSVVLVVKHWDERLMNHTFALQRALAFEVIAFEPAAEQWLHGIAWRLDVASTCPHIDLPEKSFWNDHYTPAPTAAALSAQRAGLQTLRVDLAARNVELVQGHNALADSQAALASQSSQLVARSLELAEAKRELASLRAERGTLTGSVQRPAQRTEFMPHKAPGVPAEPARPPESGADDAQAKLDLDRLFAIRDTALRQHSPTAPSASGSERPAAAGYEATQPSPLSH